MKIQNNNHSIQSSCNHRSFPFVETIVRRTAAPRRHLTCLLALVALLTVLLTPQTSHACACGCGVFEVGDLSMFPEGQGGMVFLEYDFQNQNHNWSGNSMAPGENNSDQRILTHFVTLGFQYMFNSSWGIQIELPYWNRSFTTVSDVTGAPVKLNWNGFGDMRIKGIYTGLMKDQSFGVTFGLKLPTGDYKRNDANGDIDRDSEIGTGSTDLLLGAYYHHQITKDNNWRWFAQANLDLPMFSQDGYCPGTEIDAAVGVYYNGWSIGKAKITPIAQVINSYRWSDSGPNASQPVASGYERLMLSPGIEIDVHPVMVNASVDFPIFQQMTGNQLVSSALMKVSLSFKF
jgi:hypothetical protein